MKRKIMEKRLVNYAHWYAATQGYEIGDGAQYDIEKMAGQAVTTLFGEKSPKKLDASDIAKLNQAEASFSILIATMIEQSREISGYAENNPDRIGERTMFRAIEKLCPIFPIC